MTPDRGAFDARASWGAALRFGTAESQDESRCSAIHKQRPYKVKVKVKSNGADGTPALRGPKSKPATCAHP
ncbi:MAG: hypothetical protein WA744_05530, partial [Candidatus Acidiferrales bacterium]